MMAEQKTYAQNDCVDTNMEMPPRGKVFVVNIERFSDKYGASAYQLHFCGADTQLNARGSFYAASLKDGKRILWNRNDVLGILKPELLPDSAKLQLSQIRPNGSQKPKDKAPEFFGYCFLQNGRYASGVPLYGADEVGEFVDMQKDYQHRLMICDHDDFAMLEMIDGKLIYPTEELLAGFAARQERQSGEEIGMNL
jgi:hypothetical protein